MAGAGFYVRSSRGQGPDHAPSGRGPAPAGAGALGAKNLDRPRVSWVVTIDTCDGTQYATVWGEP
eukprot:4900598-Alexandrium_andersonii.AAC.1